MFVNTNKSLTVERPQLIMTLRGYQLVLHALSIRMSDSAKLRKNNLVLHEHLVAASLYCRMSAESQTYETSRDGPC
jgi:hypothetical protein